jgi:hypothetical protein
MEKETKKKKLRAGEMTEVIEHLPSKCKVPSSNPSTLKNKTKQKPEG